MKRIMNMNINEKNLKKIADTALSAAQNTTRILMENWEKYRNPKNPEMQFSSKSDLSPVTKIDYETERIIREIVLKNHPLHKIIGEEYEEEGIKSSPYLWIIDPIDGTKHYVRGIRTFATQIAVMYENEVIVGVSNAPALNETILAVKNKGAFLNRKRIHTSNIKNIQDSFISHGSVNYFNKNKMLPQLVKLCEHSWGNRGFEDFRSYHLLASGRIDAVLEAKTKVWDIAAVSIIVKEAGGKATDFDGHPIRSDSTSIVATNNYIHDEILDFFRTNEKR